MFSRSFLQHLKVKALRKRCWFMLSLEERSIMDLTIRTVRKVRSKVLSNIILRIVLKILDLVENKLLKRIHEIGAMIAKRYVSYASRWGNIDSYEWLSDESYIFYLGLAYINTPSICRLENQV